MLVDTASEMTWVHADILGHLGIEREKRGLQFQMANGQVLVRDTGFVLIEVLGTFTVDEVVFAEPTDLQLLGSHTLQALNLVVDTRRKQLVAAGPHLVASVGGSCETTCAAREARPRYPTR